MSPARGAALAAVLALWTAAAPAHTRTASQSQWALDAEGAQVQARVPALELTRLRLDPRVTPDYAARAGAVLARELQLWSAGQPCAAGPVEARLDAGGWVQARWAVRCAQHAPREVRTQLLLGVAPGHLHFARATLPDGSTRERVLTQRDPVLALPAQAPGAFAGDVALGLDHILSGWDHLAFVLGLLLLAGSLAEMALIATGFTLAHSLTLGAAVLGVVQARATLVEALIGFTLLVVAIELAWQRAGRARWLPALPIGLLLLLAPLLPALTTAGLALFTACYFALLARSARPARLRVAMALLFGLIHGFGFAGALLELPLAAERLAPALFGFNLGIELGQLLVIALAWPLLRALARRPRAQAWVQEGAIAGLAGLGVFWLIARSVG